MSSTAPASLPDSGSVREPEPERPLHRRASRLLVWIAVLAVSLPCVLTRIAPLCDLPNHTARVHVLAHIDTSRDWDDFYTRDFQVLPNLALDLIAAPLAGWVGTTRAVQVFLLLTALVFVLGAASVAAARGRPAGVPAALAACLFFSLPLAYGFVNYMFGLGCALLAFGAWSVAGEHRHPLRRVVATTPLALVTFFSHLMPLVFLGALIAADGLSRASRAPAGRRGRTLAYEAALGLLPFLLPAVLYLGFSPTSGELTGTWQMLDPVKKLSQLGSVFVVGGGVRDLAYTGMFGVGLCLVAVLCRPRLERTGWIAVFAMLLLFAVAPQKTATADNVSIRIPTAVLLVGAAFLTFGPRSTLQRRVLVVTLGFLAGARGVQTLFKWDRELPVYVGLLDAYDKLPAGTTLFTLRDESQRRQIRESWHPPLAHAAGLAVLRQPVFYPQMFAFEGQQPLVIRTPSLIDMREPGGDYMPTYVSKASFAAWIDEFVTLQRARVLPRNSRFAVEPGIPACVLHLHDTPIDDLPTQRLEELGRGPRWVLWRIRD